MALEAISSSDLLDFMIYETVYGNALRHTGSLQDGHSILGHPSLNGTSCGSMLPSQDAMAVPKPLPPPLIPPSCFREERETSGNPRTPNVTAQGRKKRRRAQHKACKNKEEAETQRMTHIVVERNRRKQMNEHLSVLRSLMPGSYSLRGDQASIVGGAIEYVKELEHLLQSLQAQKFTLLQQGGGRETDATTGTTATNTAIRKLSAPPFAEFFLSPQYTWSQSPIKYDSKATASIADIGVTLIESHVNLRILSRRSPQQLSKLVAGFQLLHLSILHLNVITLDPWVLYSISAKLEEGCQLTCVDEIAEATHHLLTLIEDEASLC